MSCGCLSLHTERRHNVGVSHLEHAEEPLMQNLIEGLLSFHRQNMPQKRHTQLGIFVGGTDVAGQSVAREKGIHVVHGKRG